MGVLGAGSTRTKTEATARGADSRTEARSRWRAEIPSQGVQFGHTCPLVRHRSATPPATAASGTCQICGRSAETRQVGFTRNIGAIVLNFSRTTHGDMCRFCVEHYFWRYTLVSLLFGWWGVTSFFITLVWLPINIFCYVRCLRLRAPPDDAQSLADKRRRGLGAMGCGIPLALMAAAGIAAAASGLSAPTGHAGAVGSVILLAASALLGLPALLAFGGGALTYARGRARA